MSDLPVCRGAVGEKNCKGPIPKPLKGDSKEAWERIIPQGGEAIQAYLSAYNSTATHLDKCPFQDLPPSVHVWCADQDDWYASLEAAANRLYGTGFGR
ncbi:hypothetical protein ACFYXS_25020 [Streptomyces sp. NPDC002574]|uniref:hypothetical protein n=1 Tax=Streptomyces sp. NPDC002574 TaxID=3364652 RepID=UPI0036C94ED7